MISDEKRRHALGREGIGSLRTVDTGDISKTRVTQR
jgi:hypothetical protein